MDRKEYPYTTVTDGISVFDRDNQYRPLQWDQASSEIDWLDREDNGLLLTILEHMPSMEQEWSNPIINWTEDTRTEVHTTISATLTAAGTTITLVDPYIAVVDTQLVSPADGEVMRVSAVDYSASTLTIVRGQNGTAAVAKVIGDDIIAMPAYMAELDDPKDGVGRLPGESMYNFISVVSKTFKVGKMQDNSMVFDNWGQVPKAMIDTVLDMRRELGYALLFNARSTYATTNAGQMYISQGALHYNKSGFLDLGTYASKATWRVYNDFFEDRFDNDASSAEKTLICGQTQFSTLQKIMRDLGRLEAGQPYWEPTLKTMAFDIRTDSGYIVHVLLDKYGLNTSYGLGDWGFLFDMAYMSGAHYKGLGFQWFQNIQDNRSVMIREDTYLGSFSLVMKHEETHGVIRGGADRIIAR